MIAEEIKKIFKGEIVTSEEELLKASHDASVFQIKPEVVVLPKNSEDIQALVQWVTEKRNLGEKVSLTPRSGATDMGGAALTESIAVDMAAHLNNFHSLKIGSEETSTFGNPIAGYATAEPGMFYRDFEKETLKGGLIVPSYPASRELCTIGGMVSNNSGGEKTLSYGKTEDYVSELKIVLADGKEHVIRALNKEELRNKLAEEGFEGDVYRKLYKLLDENYEDIKKARPNVSKNSAGYYLWNIWDKEKGVFDLTRLLTGSQGTLGIITEITFRLIKPKPHSLLMVIFLKDLKPVADITNALLSFKPESLECYDDKTLKLAIKFFPAILRRVKQNFISFSFSFLPDLWMLIRYGMPKLVVMAEFTGDSEEEIYVHLKQVKESLRKFNVPEHLTRHETEDAKYWTIRRESFSLLRQHVKGKHTAPVIDDIVVKPEYLPEFLPKLQAILEKYSSKMTSTLAGHNGNGNFHVIPLMDFKDPEARAMLRPMMDEVYDLVLEYKGSITAEHNDGLVRTPYLEQMYGSKIVGLFKEVKDIFDPLGIFNPGKKVGGTLDEAFKFLRKD